MAQVRLSRGELVCVEVLKERELRRTFDSCGAVAFVNRDVTRLLAERLPTAQSGSVCCPAKQETTFLNWTDRAGAKG